MRRHFRIGGSTKPKHWAAGPPRCAAPCYDSAYQPAQTRTRGPNLIPIISRSIEVFIGLTVKTLLQETIETHREIVSAIAEHDAHRAHDAMLLHLVYNRRTIDDIVRRQG